MQRTIFRDKALQEEYDLRGFVTVPFLRAGEAELLARVWGDLDASIHALNFSASVMSGEPAYRRRVSAEIGAVFSEHVERLLCDYRFCFGNFIAKRAGAFEGIPIHQDAMFVDERQYESINVWVALAHVGPENGCLRVVPGSHGLNLAARGTNRRFPYPELEPLIEERYLVDVVMPMGWACVMSQRTFHTSHPNRSSSHRICASALAVPAESELYYLYEDAEAQAPCIDVYSVDDEFYRLHVFGFPVTDRAPIARVQRGADLVDAARLRAAFAAASMMT